MKLCRCVHFQFGHAGQNSDSVAVVVAPTNFFFACFSIIIMQNNNDDDGNKSESKIALNTINSIETAPKLSNFQLKYPLASTKGEEAKSECFSEISIIFFIVFSFQFNQYIVIIILIWFAMPLSSLLLCLWHVKHPFNSHVMTLNWRKIFNNNNEQEFYYYYHSHHSHHGYIYSVCSVSMIIIS